MSDTLVLTTEPDIFDALTRQVPRSERSTSGHSEFNSFVYTQSKGGPACVRACPTGAAIRISPEQLPEYAYARGP